VDSGARVLILADLDGPSTDTLAAVLRRAGNLVTVRPAPEYTYDGVTPSLANFDVVIHLNGSSKPQNSWTIAMPVAAQDSLEAFVARGGGFISSQWLGYERSTSVTTRMPNLILQQWGANTADDNCTGCSITMTTVPAQANHPVLAGIPSSFVDIWEGFSSGDLFAFQTDQPIVLMTSNSGGPAVTVRQLSGGGRVVAFAVAVNYDVVTLRSPFNPHIQQLYINAVRWAK
jgi:hypothetical protein